VRRVLGYPGGAILPAYDALQRSKIHHVGSKPIGSDAFQEPDITGVSLPITRRNCVDGRVRPSHRGSGPR